jgi:hypothetical protein
MHGVRREEGSLVSGINTFLLKLHPENSDKNLIYKGKPNGQMPELWKRIRAYL